jgi:RNA polymerase subunit RPABC4/transcription elongation factor Spt4
VTKRKRAKRNRKSDWPEGQYDEEIQSTDEDEQRVWTGRKDSDDLLGRLEKADLDPDQTELLRQACADLHSTIYEAQIDLSEPDELLYPEEPMVMRIVRTICEAAHLNLSDLPCDQPDVEFQEMAERWLKQKTQEDDEANDPLLGGPRPQSPQFLRRRAIRNEHWRKMAARLVPRKSKPAVVVESPTPQRGKRICPNCRKSNGTKLQVCVCGFRYPPKVPKPVKLGKAETFCPDCHAVFNSGRQICPLCHHHFRNEKSVLPPYISILIQQMPSFRRHQLQKAAAVHWKALEKARKGTLAQLRAGVNRERRIDRRQAIYRRRKQNCEKDDTLQYLIWVAVRAILGDF